MSARKRGAAAAARRETKADREEPRTIDFAHLCGPQAPERGSLLAPLLGAASLTLLYGPRGIGKTFLALSMAHAVASGAGLLRWQAPRAARVLYVDGEMPRAALAMRLNAIAAGAGARPEAGMLRLLASEGDDRLRPDLGTRAGIDAVERAIGDGVDLVVLDSLAVLLGGGRMNPARAWFMVEDWLLGLRRRGIAVLVVRNGNPGRWRPATTRHADVVDTVIALRRPADYDPSQGARFELHLPKARSLFGGATRSFEAQLAGTGSALRWRTLSPRDALLVRAAQLYAEGFSVREVGAKLAISRAKAGRLRDDAFALIAQNQHTGVSGETVPRQA